MLFHHYPSALLILEDGSIFKGHSIGACGTSVAEVVFNTSITGYQEIITDPSYKKQIVTFTYPHIGNTGINFEDEESSSPHLSGIIIKHLPSLHSNWRSHESLPVYLKRHDIVAIAGIDTRQLTRLLTQKGALNGVIIAAQSLNDTIEQEQIDNAKAQLSEFFGLKGMDLAQQVTTQKAYQWSEGSWQLGQGFKTPEQFSFHVVAYDFGVKHNILRLLVDRGCQLTVVPATTSVEEVLALNPDGIFLSNGPGDPEPCVYAIEAIQQLLESEIPIFGICLGHQLLGLASGAKTIKMKFGHHGGNHPVLDVQSKTVAITSQNHGFAVDEKSLPEHLQMTHKSLFDQSLQGIHHKQKPAFGFQGHPEASPGPQDIQCLFDHFIELIQQKQSKA